MKKIARLISVVAIAMALMIAFSGVASASWLADSMPENQTVKTAIKIVDWKSSSTDFNKNFNVTKSTGDTSKDLGLLPIIPASSEEMNAYRKLRATTTAKVGMTDGPLGLQYKIDAGGSKEGSMAKGRIAAGMSVLAVDGSTRLSYGAESTASGLFRFHMVMEYTSKITMP